MKTVTRTERGWPAHFICAHSCRYRRNTLISVNGKPKCVVSTVGNMVNNKEHKTEEIGYERYYETMAFKTRKVGEYIEADVSEQINFLSPWAISEIAEYTDNQADKMHEAVVAELMERFANEI